MTLRTATAVDPAIGKSDRADYTAIATCTLDTDTRLIYLREMVRGRWEAPDIQKRILEAYDRWHPYVIGIESIFFQASLFQYLKRSSLLPLREIKIRGSDNETRLMGLAPHAEAGRLVLPGTGRKPSRDNTPDHEGNPWLREFMEEWCSIGYLGGKELHKHDDQMVALAHCVQLLTLSYSASPQKAPNYLPFTVDAGNWI